MPIDPSIIGNVMVPQAVQMPDVNAMMQTQTQGMENIYKIERQRGADATAAQKEQEDNAVKALLPAYAHAFKTGNMREALQFAPPQYQDSLVPYMEALEGKPIEEIQAALTGSLVTSEVGRAFLENQARVATLGVQQGQLDVSRQDLVLRRQKQDAEAKAGSKVVQWVPNDAGDQTGLDAYGNIVATIPGIGKKTATTGPDGVKLGPGERMTEEGTVELVPGTKTYNAAAKSHSSDKKDAAIVVDKIAAAKDKLDYILDPKNKDGFEYNFGGYYAAYVGQNMPTEAAQDMYAKLESLKADLKGAGLEQLRAGGSIGQITEAEWPIIEKQIDNITPYMGEQAARDALQKIRVRLSNIAERALEAYDTQWGDTQFYAPVTAKPVTTNSGSTSAPAAPAAPAALPEGATTTNW